jgi:hypothetical protein
MTEDEAKERWCPFSRLGSSSSPGFGGMNRDVNEENGDSLRHTRCLASACAVWRETEAADFVTLKAINREGYERSPVPAKGYCGLAGSPS